MYVIYGQLWINFITFKLEIGFVKSHWKVMALCFEHQKVFCKWQILKQIMFECELW